MKTKILSLLLICLAMLPGVGQATPLAHPRLWLDATTLAALRKRAAANTATWKQLKAQCDLDLSGVVNWPDDKNSEPNDPDIGAGYQGSDYLAALLNYGLAYQTSKTTNPTMAAKYAAKGVDILTKMSDPPPSVHTPFVTDKDGGYHMPDLGYPIRNYGVGMALGYDWLYDAMTSAQRARIVTALNLWVSLYDKEGFENDIPKGIPVGNYFSGYYAAKALVALATEGDNPAATTQWADWLGRMHGQLVQPYFTTYMKDGGWPEGWEYGPLSTLNMWYAVWGAKTAKGMDLINNVKAPFSFPVDQGLSAMQLAWPNGRTMDDKDAANADPDPTPTLASFFTSMAGLLSQWNAPTAPMFHRFARWVRTLQAPHQNFYTGWPAPWQEFLFWDESASEADFTKLPLSFLERGRNYAEVRSSYATDAVWATFLAGTYISFPGGGHEGYDKGSLVIVRGGTPFLVNTIGTLMKGNDPNNPDPNDPYSWTNADYQAASDWIYNDIVGSGAVQGNRTMYNIFYAEQTNPQDNFGQWALPRDNNGVPTVPNRTNMSRMEDGHGYVFMRGSHLEDMYRLNEAQKNPVTSWTRDVIYLRPQLFVVHDRTTVLDPTRDQWLAFHVAREPFETSSPISGSHRYLVFDDGDFTKVPAFVGVVTTLFPINQITDTEDIFGKVFNITVHPPAVPVNTSASQQWLTVCDAAASVAASARATRLSANDGNVTGTNIIGTVMSTASLNYVVLFGTGKDNQTVTGKIVYTLPVASSLDILADLPANTGYGVTVVIDTKQKTQIITVVPGGGFKTSAAGVLYIDISATGKVTPGS